MDKIVLTWIQVETLKQRLEVGGHKTVTLTSSNMGDGTTVGCNIPYGGSFMLDSKGRVFDFDDNNVRPDGPETDKGGLIGQMPY